MPVRSHTTCIRWTIVRASFIGAHRIPWTAPAKDSQKPERQEYINVVHFYRCITRTQCWKGYSWNWRGSCQQLGEKVSFFSKEVTEETLTMINVSKRKTIIFECFFSQFSAQCGREEKNWLGVTSWSIPTTMVWGTPSFPVTPQVTMLCPFSTHVSSWNLKQLWILGQQELFDVANHIR